MPHSLFAGFSLSEDQTGFEVKVRDTVYLWGSDGITEDISFEKPLLLHLRNDRLGEDISVGTRVAAGTKTSLGVLKPGECLSIPLQKVSGVFATCSLGSTVACVISQ